MSQIVIVHLKMVIGLLVCNVLACSCRSGGAVQNERVGEDKEKEREWERACSHPLSHPPCCFSCSYLLASSLQMKKIITVEDAFYSLKKFRLASKPEFFQAFTFCNCISCIFNCNDLLYIDIYCELGMANCPESGSMHSSSD